jgi:hypothetical protein
MLLLLLLLLLLWLRRTAWFEKLHQHGLQPLY